MLPSGFEPEWPARKAGMIDRTTPREQTALSGFEPLTLAPKARMLTTTPQGYMIFL